MIDVSVILPVLNEQEHIEELLVTLYQSDCSIEVFVCDAGSTDETLSIVHKLNLPNLHIVPNPQQFVSFAFNKAFPLTTGKYIALLGAHAHYLPHYFDHAIRYLETECDVVGGPLLQLGSNMTGKAIAAAMSSKLGVGGTAFRTETKKMYVDSVAFAVYKRAIFETVGLLDESLVRNQDDELHYRMRAHGYKILMVPEMQSQYFVRNSLMGLFRQYFQYGLYKPLVFAKVASGIQWRHIIPAGFVCYLLVLPLLFMLTGTMVFLPLVVYLILLIIFSVKADLAFTAKVLAALAIVTLHISYGCGFILGIPRYFSHSTQAS